MPLVRSLAPGGRMLTVQSYGQDPGLELIRRIWPHENPFQANRHELLKVLKEILGRAAGNYNFHLMEGHLPMIQDNGCPDKQN